MTAMDNVAVGPRPGESHAGGAHVLLLTGIALAQTSGPQVPAIDAQRFRPTIDGRFTIWTDDASRVESFRPSFRLLAHYAHEPLVYTPEGSSTPDAVVKHLLQTDLVAGIGYQRFRIGAVLPVYLVATSDTEATQTGLGDVGVDAKAVVLDGEKAPVRIAFAGRVWFPTTTLKNALGARKVTYELTGIADRTFGDAQVGVNVGLRGGPDVQLENVRVDDYAVVRVGGGYQIVDWLAAGAEVNADVPLQNDAADALAVEWMVNGRLQAARNLQVRAAFGTGLTKGIATPDLRALVGLVWQADGPRDADGDGVPDADDACVDAAEDLDGEDDTDGCPDDVGSVVVVVLDADGAALVDAEITVGTATSKGALQAILPAGSFVVRATAPGWKTAEVPLTLVHEERDKAVVIVLDPAAVPVTVVVRGPEGMTGAPPEPTILADGRTLQPALDPGVHTLEVSAPGFVTQRRVLDVVAGVPPTAVFELALERVPLLVADDGTEGHVPFLQGVDLVGAGDVLDAAAQLLEEVPNLRLLLSGFRTEAEPAELAMQRAERVLEALVERGVDAARLDLEAAADPSETGRVELLIAR